MSFSFLRLRDWTTDLGQPRQIYQRQAEDMRRVDLKVDGLPVNALVVACYPSCLVLDLALDILKVCESSPQ